MDSSPEPEKRDWKIRGLLESSPGDSTSASIGILSSSYKKSPDYGTTELRNPVTSSSRGRPHGSVPSEEYRDKDGDVDRHGDCYHGHQSSAHVEIESWKTVRFSQSVPVYNELGKHGDSGEIGGGVREGGDVEGERGEGRKRHRSAVEGSEEKRKLKKNVPPLFGRDGLGKEIMNDSGEGEGEGGMEGGERGGEEEVDRGEREGRMEGGEKGGKKEVDRGEREGRMEGGEKGGKKEVDRGEREVKTARVSKRQRKRKTDDRQHLLEDRESLSPPPLSHHKYRRKRSSTKQSEASPSNRKEVTRDRRERLPQHVMEARREDKVSTEKISEKLVKETGRREP